MLMKLLVNVFERARSKLSLGRSSDRISTESELEIGSAGYRKCSASAVCVRQPARSSFSKWLCSTPASIDKLVPPARSQRVRRSSSWRSLKERGGAQSISSRTLSVDELHRHGKHASKHKRQHSPSVAPSHTRFDRLSSTLVHYSDANKRSHRRPHARAPDQQLFSTLSRSSGGGDSGYSEESFGARSFRRPLHTACSHCHCERRSSFSNYKKSRNNSSTESSPSDLAVKQHLLSSQSYPHIRPLPKFSTQTKPPRTLLEKRRRNLSCDSSLWTRVQSQKPLTMTSSPVLCTSQGRFNTIKPSASQPSTNGHLFGELNLAAIELDSLRASRSPSSLSSSSSSSGPNDKTPRRRTCLVWQEYQNTSLLSTSNGTKVFAVRRGDHVRVLKRIGKTTLLVQKPDDGSIGFLPQTCLAQHQINSFLSLKGLRETVL